MDLPIKIVETAPGKPHVIITWKGTNPEIPSILLSGHMDVVPVNLVSFIFFSEKSLYIFLLIQIFFPLKFLNIICNKKIFNFNYLKRKNVIKILSSLRKILKTTGVLLFIKKNLEFFNKIIILNVI